MNEFDQKARELDQNRLHIERTRAVALMIRERIPLTATMKGLEFGAGTGLLSFELKDDLGSITLIDTSQEMLKMAEAKTAPGEKGKIRTVWFDLEKEDYREATFDVIFTQMVLHHVVNVSLVLERFKDMLEPGGYLAIADLYPEDGSFHDPGIRVHQGFDPALLAGHMKALGFGNTRHSTCFTIPRPGPDGIVKEFPVFLLTARKSR